MTPTPEQLYEWAAKAGVSQLTHKDALQRFAALACAWQAEQDAKDAARYRWLRSDDIEVLPGQREIYVVAQRSPHTEDSDEVLTESALDEAIDAAMRCYVSSKLGDEVDVPEELL